MNELDIDKIEINELINKGIIEVHKDGNHGGNYPRANEFTADGILFLTAKNLDNEGNIHYSSAQRLNKKKADTLTFGYIKNGDVLLSHNATVGRVAVVKELNETALIGTSLTHFRVDSSRLLPDYLAAYFNSREFQAQLWSVMNQTTRNQVPITTQRDLFIRLPEIEKQNDIISLINPISNKIALLLKQNQTLEEIAQTLFKRWFVDFEFPFEFSLDNPIENWEPYKSSEGIFVESDLGEIPEGWEISEINEILKFVVDNRGKTAPTTQEGIPLIATNCVKNSNVFPVFEKVRYVSQDVYENWFRAHPIPGDILFVNKGTPGCINLIPDPVEFCIAQDMIALRVNDDISNIWLFLYLRSFAFQSDIKNRSVGTTIPHLKKTDLLRIKIIVPSKAILTKFQKGVKPLFKLIENNTKEIQVLTQFRDTLLPKLMNGELNKISE